jgi:hypothetical protein
MSIKKSIPNDEWQERLATFTSGNRGRKAAIAAQGMTIIENRAFRDLEYDPVGKGNDVIITLGDREETFTHTVDAPVEINLHQEEDGEISALEIIDQNGESTFLRLQIKY